MFYGMKLFVDIPDEECRFLDHCVEAGLYPSRSTAVLQALRLMKNVDLGEMYREAFAEWETSAEAADWCGLVAT